MVNNAITRYLKKGLKKGYSINSLREALLKQGHHATDVNEAIEQISPTTKTGVGKKLAVVVIIIIAVIALVVAAILFYPRIPKAAAVYANKSIVMEYAVDSLNDSLEGCSTKLNKFYTCMASGKDNASICDSYKAEAEEECKEVQENCCYDLYHEKLAILKNDASLCEKITDAEKKSSCLKFIESDVSGKCFGDLSDLHKTAQCFTSETGLPLLEDGTIESYYFDRALNNNDRNACQMIESNNMKLICIGIVDKNPSVCSKLKNLEEKYGCFSSLARFNDNISICDEIGDKSLIEKCREGWA